MSSNFNINSTTKLLTSTNNIKILENDITALNASLIYNDYNYTWLFHQDNSGKYMYCYINMELTAFTTSSSATGRVTNTLKVSFELDYLSTIVSFVSDRRNLYIFYNAIDQTTPDSIDIVIYSLSEVFQSSTTTDITQTAVIVNAFGYNPLVESQITCCFNKTQLFIKGINIYGLNKIFSLDKSTYKLNELIGVTISNNLIQSNYYLGYACQMYCDDTTLFYPNITQYSPVTGNAITNINFNVYDISISNNYNYLIGQLVTSNNENNGIKFLFANDKTHVFYVSCDNDNNNFFIGYSDRVEYYSNPKQVFSFDGVNVIVNNIASDGTTLFLLMTITTTQGTQTTNIYYISKSDFVTINNKQLTADNVTNYFTLLQYTLSTNCTPSYYFTSDGKRLYYYYYRNTSATQNTSEWIICKINRYSSLANTITNVKNNGGDNTTNLTISIPSVAILDDTGYSLSY